MKILITGGVGFIGSHLAEALLARGEQVAVLDDLSTGSVANVAEYMRALDPPAQPSVDAANIVSILGEYDQATPFAGGLELIDRWQLPTENRFIWPQGHFSLPIALTRNDAPLRRFQQIVKKLA